MKKREEEEEVGESKKRKIVVVCIVLLLSPFSTSWKDSQTRTRPVPKRTCGIAIPARAKEGTPRRIGNFAS